jgi:sugar lactone lactonase YvrE
MRGKAIGLMTLLVLVIASTSFAAVCPQVTTLGTLTGGHRFEPLRVAVDSAGNAYVTDAQNDVVNVYNPLGDRVKSVWTKYPLGVAVDDSGKVYVGSIDRHGTDKGKVAVYDSNLNPLYNLGGQFKKPLGIATSADWVYVADTQANAIKVFDITSGAYKSQFGGVGGVKLIRPSNVTVVTVDSAPDYIIVSDRSLAYNDCTYVPAGQTCDPNLQGLGAKVHVFTHTVDALGNDSWTLEKSLGDHGYQDVAGKLALIGGIAIDNAGRIIVSDRTKHYLHVFDSATGNPVCTITYNGSPGSLPQGLAATADGRLFVGASGRVIELGLDTYTKMMVSPAELAYSAQECGSPPADKTVTVSNGGPGTLSFDVTSDATWLTSSYISNTISGVGSVDVAVSVDKSGLNVGTFTNTLTVASASGEQTVTVTLEVLPPSTLNVSPSSLSFSANGGNPPAQTLGIELSGGGTWSATSDSAWLGVSPSSGSSSLIAAQVGVDATGLSNGQHTGNIIVDGSCIAAAVVVPVTLDVVAGGTIDVTTNNADASFTITGPETYSGTGTSYTVSGASVGTYTVEFGDVAGFKTPEDCSIDVTNGATATCNGEYTDIRKRLNILATAGNTIGLATNELMIYNGIGDFVGTILLQDEASIRFWDSAVSASGDVDGDGFEELVVSHDVGVITGLRLNGSVVQGLNFTPFADKAYVDLAVADVNGDGVDEIIASALNWSANGAAVRVFSYDALTQNVVDTGVNFIAYTGADWKTSTANDRRGVRIATGDIDGDGVAEILTVQGGGYSEHNILVKMFDVDASGGLGNWKATNAGSIGVNDISSYYSDIAAGDLDADGIDEIIISDTPGMTALTQPITVRAYSAAGGSLAETTVDSVRGVEVAAGDLDFDGVAEIVVGEGAFKEQNAATSMVSVFEYDGVNGKLVGSGVTFNAFGGQQVYGVRVAVGQLGSE